MSARWDRPWDPDVEYAEPPARPPLDWRKVAIYVAPLVAWMVAILLLLWAKGWIG